MGHKQTDTHRYGKGSYHQIGLVRGQFGGVPMDKWVKFVQETGFDGWEEASWELDLAKCDTDAGAEAYAKERVDLAKKHGLEIFTVAAHLQGQALGDEPSAKTLQFVGGDAAKAYKEWRDSGKQPPRTDPYYVPDEVGKLIHKQAAQSIIRCARLSHYLGKLQNRRIAMSSFVGSPAHCWSHFFLFPPLPSSIAGHAIPDVRLVSLELLVERFAPVWDACRKYGVTYDLECHPSERAMGDIESATDYIKYMNKAGYEGVVGFNLDGSHMEWQGVSVVQFIRELGHYIHCAHIKGVQVIREHTRAGLLGGHRPMGHALNGWNFVTAGSARDANSVEEIMIELNRVGFDGAVSIEWEDNDAEQHAGAKSALANVRRGDLAPSGMRHDETLKA
jgi:sugar phosphate isomerase/epimerase